MYGRGLVKLRGCTNRAKVVKLKSRGPNLWLLKGFIESPTGELVLATWSLYGIYLVDGLNRINGTESFDIVGQD